MATQKVEAPSPPSQTDRLQTAAMNGHSAASTETSQSHETSLTECNPIPWAATPLMGSSDGITHSRPEEAELANEKKASAPTPPHDQQIPVSALAAGLAEDRSGQTPSGSGTVG